jgi:hypothetical protein
MNNIIAIPRVERREPIEVSSQNPAPPNTPIDITSVVSMVLLTEQVVRLDEIAAQVRRRSGKTISRSGMIRAILSAVLPCHEDWVKVTSEADLQQMVALRLTVVERQAEIARRSSAA